jgi:hypothetical protein
MGGGGAGGTVMLNIINYLDNTTVEANYKDMSILEIIRE